MTRTRRNVNPSFDDPESFVLDVKTGVIRANVGDIGNFLNASGSANSPLKNITLSGDGNQIKLDGTLHKIISLPIGKIDELTAARRLGYSTRGQLVGHVALGLEILERHVAGLVDFPLALKTLLQHLIVSHHGEVEKGALREPMLAEAVVLHALDELDARLEQVWRVIDQAPQAMSGRPMCRRCEDKSTALPPTRQRRARRMGRSGWPEIDRLKACYELREQGVNFAVVWQ